MEITKDYIASVRSEVVRDRKRQTELERTKQKEWARMICGTMVPNLDDLNQQLEMSIRENVTRKNFSLYVGGYSNFLSKSSNPNLTMSNEQLDMLIEDTYREMYGDWFRQFVPAGTLDFSSLPLIYVTIVDG